MDSFTALIEQLHSSHVTTRKAAVQALTKLPDKRVVPILLRALAYDPEKQIRVIAANCLAELRDTRAVLPLIKRLQRDSETSVICAAAKGLGELGDWRAVVPLRHCAEHHANPDCRSWAIGALGALGDSRAVPLLLSLLSIANQSDHWQSIIVTVGKIGDARAVMPLLELLPKFKHTYKCMIIEALGKLADDRALEPLLQLLTTDDRAELATVAQALADLQNPCAIEPLLARIVQIIITLEVPSEESLSTMSTILGEWEDHVFFKKLIKAITQFGERSFAPLSQLLLHEHRHVRHFSLQCFENLHDTRAVPLLRERAQADSSRFIRVKAFDVLVYLKDIDFLIHEFQQCADEELQVLIVIGLTTLEDTRVIQPLVEFLQTTQHEELLGVVAIMLPKRYDPKIAAALRRGLLSTDVFTRLEVAKYLGRGCDPVAEAVLIDLLTYPHIGEKQDLVDLLQQYDTPKAWAAIEVYK